MYYDVMNCLCEYDICMLFLDIESKRDGSIFFWGGGRRYHRLNGSASHVICVNGDWACQIVNGHCRNFFLTMVNSQLITENYETKRFAKFGKIASTWGFRKIGEI